MDLIGKLNGLQGSLRVLIHEIEEIKQELAGDTKEAPPEDTEVLKHMKDIAESFKK